MASKPFRFDFPFKRLVEVGWGGLAVLTVRIPEVNLMDTTDNADIHVYLEIPTYKGWKNSIAEISQFFVGKPGAGEEEGAAIISLPLIPILDGGNWPGNIVEAFPMVQTAYPVMGVMLTNSLIEDEFPLSFVNVSEGTVEYGPAQPFPKIGRAHV